MLNGTQKRYLRAMANGLEPIVQVGKAGAAESLFSLNEALEARELVKVKVLKNCLEEVQEVAEELAAASQAEMVQIIGRNIVFYRRHSQKPVIVLPKK